MEDTEWRSDPHTDDITDFTAVRMPRCNSISVSGCHMQKAGATLLQKQAFSPADGGAYMQQAIARGRDIKAFAPRLLVAFAVGMNLSWRAIPS